MAKKLFDVSVVAHWEIVPGQHPELLMLRLRHKPLREVQAEGPKGGGTTVLLVLSREQVHDLANDLLGKTAAEPRPERLDS